MDRANFEYVYSSLCAHAKSKQKADQASANNNQGLVMLQPQAVINDGGNDSLNNNKH